MTDVPHSLRDNDIVVRDYVARHGFINMLDVGAGSGTYGRLLADLVPHRTALEVWEPYVEGHGLREVYNRGVIVQDVRELARMPERGTPRRSFDLVVLGDVLEHMSAEDGLAVWHWASRVARHGVISVPTVHWPQGAVGGNPYEEHVQDHLHAEDYVAAYGPFDETHLFAQTATFIREFP